MESALNRAHQLERKAETLLRSLKLEEAIACHEKTAELLTEAMQLTKAEKALESLQLQHDYHRRRQAIIRYKQAVLDRVRAMSKQMSKASNHDYGGVQQQQQQHRGPLRSEEDEAMAYLNDKATTTDLQNAIYRHIDENDSLLRGLIGGGGSGGGAQSTNSGGVVFVVMKTPKDEKTVIEELQTNNGELRRFVDDLVTQLEASRLENGELRAEVEELRRRIRDYEAERRQMTLGGEEDSTSSSAELSPVGGPPRSLPPLAPLEMPPFDFLKFESGSSDSQSSEVQSA